MANLRIDDTRRVAPGQAPGQFDAPDASRGAEFASRQMQAAGQAVQQGGQVAANIYTAEREKLNETRVNDALARAQRAAQEQQAEWSTLRGEAALKVGETEQPITDVYAPRFEQSASQIADDMGLTAEQRRRYTEQVAPLASRVRGSLTEHLMRESETYNQQVYTSGVATYQSAIRDNPGDPEIRVQSVARIRELTAAESRRLGLPAAAAAIAEQNNVGKALLDVVKDLADENVDEAQAYFDENYESMTAEQRDAARTVLRPALEARTAEQVADMFSPQLGGAVAAPGGAASFDQSMTSIWASEGSALVAEDNGAGRARFGITERSHPQAWADGDVTREEANTIYRRDYWNAIGADDLPAGLAHIAFDTAVNMGAGRARELLAQADGDVVKFAQLRRAEYRRIAAADEDGSSRQFLGAWLERVDKVEMEALGQTPAGSSRAPTMSVTQAVAAARAALPPGAPPTLVRTTEAEVRRRYADFDRAEAEGFAEAEDEAFRHIEANRAMPGPDIISRLKPGRLETIRNYFDTVTAPPTVRSDPTVLMAIAANPGLITEMRPEEIVATYGRSLSSNDLISLIGTSARASTAARAEAQKSAVVPQEAFSSAWSATLDASGIDRTPAGRTADSDRQALAQVNASVREEVIERQRTLGRQMNREEIAVLIENRLSRLAWERPQGILQPYATGFQTSYETMIPTNQREYRTRARERLGRNPTEAEIFQEYVRNRIRGN